MRLSMVWLFVAAACTVDEVDLEGKACPCASGYSCDDNRNVCVKSGGAGGQAGASTGGTSSGGTSTGGTATGGTSTGGTTTGGTSTGGTSTGGTSTGGTSTGGTATGGTSTGGTSTGGTAGSTGTGGSGTGGGAGTCAAGLANCNTSSPDCETNVWTSDKRCGSCSQDCSVMGSGSNGFACVAGQCLCTTDVQCDATLAAGSACVTTLGVCTCAGTQCLPGEICAKTGGVTKCSCQGSGACSAGEVCCSSGGCKDLSSDTQNCGACGIVCKSGTCVNGTCS